MPFINESFREDPRDGLDLMKRADLARLCREAGLEFDSNTTTKADYKQMIRSNNIDPSSLLKKYRKPSKMETALQEKNDLQEKVDKLESQVMALLEASQKKGPGRPKKEDAE